ncbi:MAG: hypothetical protein ABSA83_23495 [Verrucomicrobiota bacterium]
MSGIYWLATGCNGKKLFHFFTVSLVGIFTTDADGRVGFPSFTSRPSWFKSLQDVLAGAAILWVQGLSSCHNPSGLGVWREDSAPWSWLPKPLMRCLPSKYHIFDNSLKNLLTKQCYNCSVFLMKWNNG